MNKLLKKTLCVLLSILMISSFGVISLAWTNATSTYPVVYVEGQGAKLTTVAQDGNSEQIYSVTIPDGYIGDRAKELIRPLAKGIAGDWTEYCDTLYKDVVDLYGVIALDKNGEASDGSGCPGAYYGGNLRNYATSNGYNIESYTFHYDWRLDPFELANRLDTYIEAVKAATGYSKVNLIGRCLGANIVLAYLQSKGCDDVNSVVFYCAGFDGFMLCSKLFSGKIAIDGGAIDRYSIDNLGSDYVMELVKASVALANKTSGMAITSEIFNSIYSQVGSNLVPRILMSTYGTFPSYWSMVGDADYEDAKALAFGDNTEEYATFISKIDNYHYNIMLKTDDIIDEAMAQGVNVYNVCKYGLQLIPVVEQGDIQSDRFVETVSSAMGATCAPVDGTLTADYIASVKAAGNEKYLSADNQIDASTCYLRDSTWFIKNLEHRDFPECINDLFNEIFHFDGQMTVEDSKIFGRFMLYDSETLTVSPLSSDNGNTHPNWSTDFFTVLKNFFDKLINFFIVLINKIEIK